MRDPELSGEVGVVRVVVRKAEAVAGQVVEDLVIESVMQPFPTDREDRREAFRKEGRAIVRGLLSALPGATVDAVIVELLAARHSELIVRVPEYEVERMRAAIESAACLLGEGPDVVGGFAAREQALRVLLQALRVHPR